ncbi:MAG TPA: hypothetical protein VNZ49_17400 [Bacteroidia bacterium]|jgi:hypothetical protein|nr:hypothetical protein [Bacteroidia bacterium]
MLNKRLVYFLLILSQYASAQNYETPHNPKGGYNTRALKGKILPFVFGDGGGINLFLGYEYGFCKHHSIGVDLYLLAMGSSGEIYDSIQKTYVPGYASGRNDKAVFVNYRYYFGFQKWRAKHELSFYTGTFFRYGYWFFDYEEGYKTNIVSQNETSYSEGILLGCIVGVFDLNMGFYYRQLHGKEVLATVTGNIPFTYDHNYYGFRIGANLYLWGKRAKNKN